MIGVDVASPADRTPGRRDGSADGTTMSGRSPEQTVGSVPGSTADSPLVPVALTLLVWSLFVATVGALPARIWSGAVLGIDGLLVIDGLAVLIWAVVTFFSGIVHSYAPRYMAGSAYESEFFATVFGFTLAVMALVAADHLALFAGCWLVMGLLMAHLIGVVEGWPQAQAAAGVARRSFLASSVLVAVGLAALWWDTGATTATGVAAANGSLGGPLWILAAVALVLAAMLQSALVPFHGWLLSSMTAPTPASALMHAGFVNAGGILLSRFAPVVTVHAWLMLAVVAIGATSALGGKPLKSVRTDAKGTLGSSTIAQMGFMVMQAGLGFFGAAITHLVLHGF
jgi:NAD(P)H-quinone oxidoreductase subunit 5